MSGDRQTAWIVWLGAGLLGLALAAVFAVWTPSDDPADSICLLRRTSGVACPGCGFTRGWAHLAKGEWARAFERHPLAPWVAAEAIGGWLVLGAVLLRRAPPPRDRFWSRLLVVHAVLFGAVWAARLLTGTLP